MTKIISVRLDFVMMMKLGARKHAVLRMSVLLLPSVTSIDVLASNVFTIVNVIAFFVIKECASKPESAV